MSVTTEDTTGSTRSGTQAEPTPGADDTTPPGTPGPHLFGSRGRHRRPRPRRVLLAAGGLVLAAGALSLVRLMPDPGADGLSTAKGTPDPAPGKDTSTDTDRATNTAATFGAVPDGSPSAPSAMGGPTAAPTTSTIVIPTPGTTTAPTTTPATAPRPTHTTPPRPPAAAPPTTAPQPPTTQTPPHPAANSPAPRPSRPGGVCVPVIGLCVDPLSDGG
ncbi:hypothetical protein [Streptomyces dysideae]|uniref:hypothetical protein n=1 Tax=Streptomyces dysideae TaxID=909626 RepID=UPI000AEE1816|nr:hypothetical protein [Streptomyces dysideae]